MKRGAGIVLPRPSKGAGVAHRFAGGDGFFVPYIAEAQLAREGFPAGQLGQLLAIMHELDHNNLRALLDPLRRLG